MTDSYKPYSAATTAKKGTQDGAMAMAVVTVVTAIVQAIQANNPDATLGAQTDALVIGGVSGGILGGIRAFRNWWKNRK